MLKTTEISANALYERINRRLAHAQQQLHKAGGVPTIGSDEPCGDRCSRLPHRTDTSPPVTLAARDGGIESQLITCSPGV